MYGYELVRIDSHDQRHYCSFETHFEEVDRMKWRMEFEIHRIPKEFNNHRIVFTVRGQRAEVELTVGKDLS